MGEHIRFSGIGQEAEGYLAKPANGKGVGVIVLQEWWGLVGHITAVCDRFAKAGFVALAPDLYGGKTTTEPDEAESLMMALNIAEAERILRGAVERLLADEATLGQKVGIVGFCMGGQLSMFAACANPQIGACVNFYGIHPNVHPDFESLQAPILGFFADLDPYATPEAVDALDATLRAAGKSHRFFTFANTHHAFFNSDRPEVFSEEASEQCWERMLAFFKEHLA